MGGDAKRGNGVIEAENSEPVMLRLGGDLKSITPIELPEVEEKRYLLAVAKTRETPKCFPAGQVLPSKIHSVKRSGLRCCRISDEIAG